MGDGVCVNAQSPLTCSAASRNPTAMPTDSRT